MPKISAPLDPFWDPQFENLVQQMTEGLCYYFSTLLVDLVNDKR